MRFRGLALFPLVYAALFLLIAWQLGNTHALDTFVVGQRLLVRVLAVVGCFAAASVFERGDHLQSAWRWLGWGAVAILVLDVLRLTIGSQGAAAPLAVQVTLSAVGVLSNLALLAGIWALSRSWKLAAIELPGGRLAVVGISVVTILLALAVAGPDAVASARQVIGGDVSATLPFVSAVVDVITLSLITPLLLIAVSLRGGLFSWPWGLLTASQVCWLLYDGAAGLTQHFSLGSFPIAETFRCLAETLLFCAGIAQYMVIRQVRRGAAV
jgi:hypothetical protein